MTLAPAAMRVAASFNILDLRGPIDWSDKINVDYLDIMRSDECALGHIYGGYHEGLGELGLDRCDFNYAFTGYDVADSKLLTEEWKHQLAVRREVQSKKRQLVVV